MELIDKLEILADAAKYDVACTSSGSDRGAVKGSLGSTHAAGCCHSFTADGRCVSLLKVLMTNVCVYDCAYCSSRRSNELIRTAFKPSELADLTMEFYRRNYIEGLFLSSGVLQSPDYTTELMIETFRLLREQHRFRGYIHAKTVPGTSPELIKRMGELVDRLSVNLELPSQESLSLLAPDKSRQNIIEPMRFISEEISENRELKALARRKSVYYGSSIKRYEKTTPFAPAGQSTQIMIGASPESDYHILNLTSALYRSFSLKRVFFSAYMPVNDDKRLPSTDAVQLDREHRLYQADWLLRFYRFEVSELIDRDSPFLDLRIDPKSNWALNNLDRFPLEINRAPYEMLLRIPGVGVRGAQLIMRARRESTLRLTDLAKLGIAVKRARYFITCNGEYAGKGISFSREAIRSAISAPIDGGSHGRRADKALANQLSLFDSSEYQSAIKQHFKQGRKSMGDRRSSPLELKEWHELPSEMVEYGNAR